MRTTVTLDDDLAELLKQRAKERDVPFKSVLNEALRAGLERQTPRPRRYRMKPSNLGVRPGVDLTKFALDNANKYTPTYKSNNVWGG